MPGVTVGEDWIEQMILEGAHFRRPKGKVEYKPIDSMYEYTKGKRVALKVECYVYPFGRKTKMGWKELKRMERVDA